MAPPSKSSADSVAESVTRKSRQPVPLRQISASVESSKLSGTLMEIDDWIERHSKKKGYIQAQEHRENFIIAAGAG